LLCKKVTSNIYVCVLIVFVLYILTIYYTYWRAFLQSQSQFSKLYTLLLKSFNRCFARMSHPISTVCVLTNSLRIIHTYYYTYWRAFHQSQSQFSKLYSTLSFFTFKIYVCLLICLCIIHIFLSIELASNTNRYIF
jgi:hypothetical protein